MNRNPKANALAIRGLQVVAATLAVGLPSIASATQYDLSAPGSQALSVPGDVGGTAIFSDYFSQPTGTGVFEPFLTIDSNGQTSTGSKKIEQGYNTDGFSGMYLDQLRPQWNDRLTLGDLAQVQFNGNSYYVFLLDANEPNNANRTISIDNIRIYTSATDNTGSVGNNTSILNSLGTLRWALNDGLMNADGSFNIDDWIKLDASQENVDAGSNASNGGSGKSDMAVYIPVAAFAGALSTDYVWFYNLNGVHYAADSHLAAQSGYEEWRAVFGPNHQVPDGGATLALLGTSILGVGMLRRRFMK